ncbi:hypothetical protein Ahy_A09g043314 isoform A [Arachis hypogaea]|uniref:Uncharacterized protein n=1 Tax=Arachis hypogaea TaxID=3818 RepID=A0A445BHZ5_ARAHY|nr:hypothetical protein Ahy_A09g043314 isoform A [Arachis hypogaea]
MMTGFPVSVTTVLSPIILFFSATSLLLLLLFFDLCSSSGPVAAVLRGCWFMDYSNFLKLLISIVVWCTTYIAVAFLDSFPSSTYCSSLYEHCIATRHIMHIYSQSLEKLAPHIQQVSIESNGKGVLIDGIPLPFEAGEVGSNHDELMTNFFAQPDALAYEKI